MSAYKPAKLDASLLLARKGEATPAIQATIYNNPAFAWGGEQHPDDFKAKIYPLHPNPNPNPNQNANSDTNVNSETNNTFATKTTPIKSASINIGITLDSDVFLRTHYIAHKMHSTIEHVIRKALDRDLLRHGLLKSSKFVLTLEKRNNNT